MKKTETYAEEEALELLINRLINQGLSSVHELINLCKIEPALSCEDLEACINESPLTGRRPTFQNRIEAAVLGVTFKSKGE